MPSIKLQPNFVEKIWGKDVVPNHPVDKLGKRIGELWFGSPSGTRPPLQVRYIYTSVRLSTHIHAHRASTGQEECWYILEAEPASMIGIGTIVPLKQPLQHHAAEIEAWAQFIDWRPARAGDFYFVPAGTIYAIGAGISLVEVQQNIDLTCNRDGHDRTRGLETKATAGDLQTEQRPAVALHRPLGCSGVLLDDGPFGLRLAHMQGGDALHVTNSGLAWFIPLRGRGDIDGLTWRAGECWLLTQPTPLIRAASDTDYLFATV